MRELVRAYLRRRIPEISAEEVRQWAAGHGESEPHNRYWSDSKRHQNVYLWGTSKTCDVFVYHPEGKYRLPRRGISVGVKYVPSGSSPAAAIATVAGQLLAYSLRHERTIGFVFCAGSLRQKPEDQSTAFLKALPSNAALIVRFGEPKRR